MAMDDLAGMMGVWSSGSYGESLVSLPVLNIAMVVADTVTWEFHRQGATTKNALYCAITHPVQPLLWAEPQNAQAGW